MRISPHLMIFLALILSLNTGCGNSTHNSATRADTAPGNLQVYARSIYLEESGDYDYIGGEGDITLSITKFLNSDRDNPIVGSWRPISELPSVSFFSHEPFAVADDTVTHLHADSITIRSEQVGEDLVSFDLTIKDLDESDDDLIYLGRVTIANLAKRSMTFGHRHEFRYTPTSYRGAGDLPKGNRFSGYVDFELRK